MATSGTLTEGRCRLPAVTVASRLGVTLAGTALLLAWVVTGAGAQPAGPPPSPGLDAPPPAAWGPEEIDAAAWILVEGQSGQLLAGEQVEERRPVASTVKVLTALSVVTRVELDDEVVVGDEVVGIGGATVGLVPGSVWRVEELLDALLARSGNDAAVALAAHVAGSTPDFVAMMAQDARRLGLDELTLTSPSGLDDDNLVSARDLATITRAALAHPSLRPLLARSVVELPGLGAVESRNELLDRYPAATGVKTGYTAAAGYSLVASAERDGRELVVVVLDADPDPARYEVASRLLDHGFDRFAVTTLRGRLTLAVAGGELHLEVAPTPVTAPVAEPAVLAFELPVRPPTGDVDVPVQIGDEMVGQLRAARVGRLPPREASAAELGQAVVDGVYAALRASTTAGVLR